MKQSRRFTHCPDVGTISRAAHEEVVAAIRTPASTNLRGRVVPAREQGVKIAAIDMNFPNRGGVVLSSSQREPKPSTVGRKTNRVRRPGNRYQFLGVRSIRASEKDVRSLSKRELPTVGRPRPPMTDNIREMSGASRRQRQCPKLRVVPQNGVIRHQELRMIGRNVRHKGVAKWSRDDRRITTGDGCLNQELL